MMILLLALILSPVGEEVLPIPLETPPFEYMFRDSTPASENPGMPHLELVQSTPNSVTDTEQWFEEVVDSWPAITFHGSSLHDASQAPLGIPEVLQTPGEDRFHLSQVIFSAENTIAFYGSPPNQFGYVQYRRLLMVMDRDISEPSIVLDFLTYAHPDDGREYGERSAHFQALTWAEVDDGILYVSNAHRTYAGPSGMNAYITALDLETLEVLWRSEPLVSNSFSFLIVDDAIITGYGFTAEDDFVYILDRRTGEVVESITVPTAPRYFYREDDTLYVRCYDTDCVFEIIR